MSFVKTINKRFSGIRFAGEAQPADGIYDCRTLPTSLTDAGLPRRASGILLTFVPPEADFYQVSQAW